MPEQPCPVCGRPRKRGADRNLLKTCGSPSCVAARQGQRYGQAQVRQNFRMTAGGHTCHQEPDGTWVHWLCGGPEGDHECVRHAGYCDYRTDRPEPFRPDLLSDKDAWIAARREAPADSPPDLPSNAIPCTTPDDPLCQSLGLRHGHPKEVAA